MLLAWLCGFNSIKQKLKKWCLVFLTFFHLEKMLLYWLITCRWSRLFDTHILNFFSAAMRHPSNTKHLHNICTMLNQLRRRWADVVQVLYRCFLFDGIICMDNENIDIFTPTLQSPGDVCLLNAGLQRWSITPYIVWINLWQINQSCHNTLCQRVTY